MQEYVSCMQLRTGQDRSIEIDIHTAIDLFQIDDSKNLIHVDTKMP